MGLRKHIRSWPVALFFEKGIQLPRLLRSNQHAISTRFYRQPVTPTGRVGGSCRSPANSPAPEFGQWSVFLYANRFDIALENDPLPPVKRLELKYDLLGIGLEFETRKGQKSDKYQGGDGDDDMNNAQFVVHPVFGEAVYDERGDHAQDQVEPPLREALAFDVDGIFHGTPNLTHSACFSIEPVNPFLPDGLWLLNQAVCFCGFLLLYAFWSWIIAPAGSQGHQTPRSLRMMSL